MMNVVRLQRLEGKGKKKKQCWMKVFLTKKKSRRIDKRETLNTGGLSFEQTSSLSETQKDVFAVENTQGYKQNPFLPILTRQNSLEC